MRLAPGSSANVTSKRANRPVLRPRLGLNPQRHHVLRRRPHRAECRNAPPEPAGILLSPIAAHREQITCPHDAKPLPASPPAHS